MSTAITSGPPEDTEKFQTKTSEAIEHPEVENVWKKRTLEKQLSASNTEGKSQNEEASNVKQQTLTKDTPEHSEFQEVKNRKDKKDDRKDERMRKTDKKDADKKDIDKKEKKGDKEEKKEDIVKKFDNVNYVEAPLPKTNPWGVSKPVANITEAGQYIKICVN